MEEILAENPYKIKDFKSICSKIGLTMVVYFVCRILANITSIFAAEALSGADVTLRYFVGTLISILMVYVVPMIFTAMILGSAKAYKGRFKSLYTKPQKLVQAMGNFGAVYGLGQAVNLLTLLVIFIVSRSFGLDEVSDSYRTLSSSTPPNLACGFIFAFLAIVIAPFAEELWVRGIVFDALKPYGKGFTIIVTAIMFGAMHSNIKSFFFTTALGLALGYITYATGSIFVSTIMHAIFNSISSIMIIFMCTPEISNLMSGELAPEGEFITAVFGIYLVIVYAAVIFGIAAFIGKIKTIKKYKIPNIWNEITVGQKWGVFLTSIPVMIFIVLAVNANIGDLITQQIDRLLLGLSFI